MSDRVCIGSSKGQEVCIDDLGFIEAVEMTDNPFEDLPFDGILGLGLLDLSVTDQFNLLFQL